MVPNLGNREIEMTEVASGWRMIRSLGIRPSMSNFSLVVMRSLAVVLTLAFGPVLRGQGIELPS